ncbi:HIT family protein [Patescibacteria group bacterium]|nr:MAG: HIT family protein [Patescibacteria group bacterium]
MTCIFCDIVAGKAPSHPIWEDDHHLAFLSIFPNTEGASVVVPKRHSPSYAFDVHDDVLIDLVLATGHVARRLDGALQGVGRTAMVLEGFGVDHLHAKLFPMHGTQMAEWRPVSSTVRTHYATYPGFIASHDGERADEAALASLAAKIRSHISRADMHEDHLDRKVPVQRKWIRTGDMP